MYGKTVKTVFNVLIIIVSALVLVSCGTHQSKPVVKTSESSKARYAKSSQTKPKKSIQTLTPEEKQRRKQLEKERRLDYERKDSLRALLVGTWRKVRPTVFEKNNLKYQHCESTFNELKNSHRYELFVANDFAELEYKQWLSRYELQTAMTGDYRTSQRYKVYWGGRELDILEGRLEVKDWLAELLPGGGKGKRRFVGFIVFDRRINKTIGGAGRFSSLSNEKLEMRLFEFDDTLYVLRLFHKKKGTELDITPLIRRVQKEKESCRWFRVQ